MGEMCLATVHCSGGVHTHLNVVVKDVYRASKRLAALACIHFILQKMLLMFCGMHVALFTRCVSVTLLFVHSSHLCAPSCPAAAEGYHGCFYSDVLSEPRRPELMRTEKGHSKG